MFQLEIFYREPSVFLKRAMILIMQGSMDHRIFGTMSTVLKANGKS
jgi:hypothetical protein